MMRMRPSITHLFFDIETYSPNSTRGPKYSEKIITIAYKTDDSQINVLKEWETGEEEVIKQFLAVIEGIDRPNLVGHNILRFDIPVIACRSTEHGLRPMDEVFTLLFDSYSVDTIQCLLPSNGLYFKGLTLRNYADKLGIRMKGCPSSKICTHYETGNYEAIIEHVKEDVLAAETLYNHLKRCHFNPFYT